jgi:hypothetical protein
MTNQSFDAVRDAIAKTFTEHWKLFLIEGIILVVLGVLAVMVPLLAGLALKFLEAARHSGAIEIAPMSVEAERYAPKVLDHQRFMNRFHHSDGDIGIAPQKIVDLVRENELDFKSGIVMALASVIVVGFVGTGT